MISKRMKSVRIAKLAAVLVVLFLACTLWTNTIANRALRKQILESVDFARQAPQTIYRKLERIVNKAPVVVTVEKQGTTPSTPTQQCNEPDWGRLDFKDLTANQLIDYFLWANRSSCRVVNDFGGVMRGDKSRVANDAQKAVCLDRTVAPVPDKCLVYSFGINYDWTFDEDMELYGCRVLSFDPSMNISNQTRSPLIEFFRMGLSDRDRWDDLRWPNVPMLTLNSFYELFKSMHGDAMIDYLKIDVESAEWSVIPQMLRSGMLDKVRQFSAEFHLPANSTLEHLRSLAEIVRSLESYGMIRFDCKPNLHSVVNMPHLGFKAFDCYEIAFYNSKHVRHNVDIDSPI